MWERCHDKRECYGRNKAGGCLILTRTYIRDGVCPFCKPDREVTKGKKYPVDKNYTGGE